MIPQQRLIAAGCKRCGRLFALYIIDSQQPAGQWLRYARVEHRDGKTGLQLACICDPAPPLPEGERLEKLLARARARKHDASRFQAPLKIMV